MKLARLIKMCLNGTDNRIRVGKHLFDIFQIKNGLNKEMPWLQYTSLILCRHYLLTLLWGKPLGGLGFQVDKEGLKLNGTHQRLIYVGDVNILGGRIDTIKKT
jgi:hypothetical protein